MESVFSIFLLFLFCFFTCVFFWKTKHEKSGEEKREREGKEVKSILVESRICIIIIFFFEKGKKGEERERGRGKERRLGKY